MAKLSRLVASSESLHKLVTEGTSSEFEVIEDIGTHLKLKLKDKLPPLVIKVIPIDSQFKNKGKE